MTGALASVVVVSRDGFGQAPACLARLVDVTETPFRLVYVDGNAPARIARRLRRLVVRHGGTLVRTNRFLRPTHARNLGFRDIDTRYTVFLDNDVLVTPGWLDALVRCAEETGAAFVSPIVCMAGQTALVVHVAGGENRLVSIQGRHRLIETYGHAGEPLSRVLAEVSRAPTTMAEFHAVLVRTESLRAAGGLDECCPTAFEHNDLCLALAARGCGGWLEPASTVMWAPGSPAAGDNRQYHMVRWCRSWIDQSLAGFCCKWDLEPHDPGLAASLQSLHERRRRPTQRIRAIAGRLAGARAVARIDALSDWWVDAILQEHHQEKPTRALVSQWPGPHA